LPNDAGANALHDADDAGNDADDAGSDAARPNARKGADRKLNIAWSIMAGCWDAEQPKNLIVFGGRMRGRLDDEILT